MAGCPGGNWQIPFFDATLDATKMTIKASSGYIHSIEVDNQVAARSYLQLFDIVLACVTVGTTVPTQSFTVPANGSMDKTFTKPMKFDNAISYAFTTTPTGNSAPACTGTLNIGYR